MLDYAVLFEARDHAHDLAFSALPGAPTVPIRTPAARPRAAGLRPRRWLVPMLRWLLSRLETEAGVSRPV